MPRLKVNVDSEYKKKKLPIRTSLIADKNGSKEIRIEEKRMRGKEEVVELQK